MDTKEEDWVEHLFVASTHDYLMIFTRGGQCYWKKVWEIPVGSRISRGKPIVNLLNLGPDEQIAAVVPVREFSEDQFLMFGTRLGTVKKTPLSAYGNVRSVGLNAINIEEGDELIEVRITSGSDEILIASRKGMAIRFKEEDARPMGRATAGVRGLRLKEGDEVVGLVVAHEDSTILVVSENGLGKRTVVDAYRLQKRGGSGVINLKTSAKTGEVVAIRAVSEDEQLMMITKNGVVNRQNVSEIRVIGRATQGVKLMNLDEGDVVVDVARVVADDEEEDAETLTAEAGVEIEGVEHEGAEIEADDLEADHLEADHLEADELEGDADGGDA
jgi:DNA gyrase subunit A